MSDELFNLLLQEQRLTNQILRAAHRPQLEALARTVGSDPVMAATLRELETGTVSAGDLKSLLVEATKVSESTVKRRLAEMEVLGLLERIGAGSNITYRSTGLVSVD